MNDNTIIAIIIGVALAPALLGWVAGRVYGVLVSLLYYAALAWIVGGLDSHPQDLFTPLAELLAFTAIWGGVLWSLFVMEN